MRLIDADALLLKMRRQPVFERTEEDRRMVYVERSVILSAPTIAAAPQWISVEDRLPEDAGGAVDAVLVTDGFLIHMAYFNHGTWYFCESGEMKEEMFYNVTHWMPLPEPPKMDTEN